MQRSPEMIRELLRGMGEVAAEMNLEEYCFVDLDDEDLSCEFYFNDLLKC